MSLKTRFFTVLTLLLMVVACDSNNGNNNNNDPGQSELVIAHASPDAPNVNLYLDGGFAATLAFGESFLLEPLLGVELTSVNVELRGVLPDDTQLTVIGPVDVALQDGERVNIIAFNNLFNDAGDLSIEAKVLDPIPVEEDIDKVRISVFHAAAQVDEVDIYVTLADNALPLVDPITLDFGDAAGPVVIDADTQYRVQITPASSQTVVYDSGPVRFAAGEELVLVAVDNIYKVGNSPVNLLAVAGEGKKSELLNIGLGGAVRVVHDSADTPAVDVLVDGVEALDGLTFPNGTSYDIEADAGTYNVVVAADADNAIAPIDIDLTLAQGESVTVIAIGSLAEETLTAIETQDDRRNIATAAVVEVIHGSYFVAADIPVDVYLTADGVIADQTPAISNLAYGESTGQIQVTPGSYWITVTAAGDKSIVAFDTGATLDLDGGVNYTIIARDPSAEEGVGMPLINVILLTD